MAQNGLSYPNDEAAAFAALKEYTDSVSFDIDPQLLSSAPASPLNTVADTPLLPPADGSPFRMSDHPISPYAPASDTFWTTHHPSPLRHQLMGHRRSVSQPPEDHPTLLLSGPAPPVIFSRGDLQIGETNNAPPPGTSRHGGRPLARGGAKHDRNGNGSSGPGARHHPYPTAARDRLPNQRYHLRRTQTQPVGVPHPAPTSAPVMPMAQARAPCLYPGLEMQTGPGAGPAHWSRAASPAPPMLLQSPMSATSTRHGGGDSRVMERVKEAIGTVLEVVRRTERGQMEQIGTVLEAVERVERRQAQLEGLIREMATGAPSANDNTVTMTEARDERTVNGQDTEHVATVLREYDEIDSLFEDDAKNSGFDGELEGLFGDLTDDFRKQMVDNSVCASVENAE